MSEPAVVHRDVVCAVDGGPATAEAVHQAIALCGGGTALHFVAARQGLSRDPSAPPDLTEMQARNALELAIAMARSAGIPASVGLLRGRPVSELLLTEATRHELLVLGCHSRPALGRTPIGSTATRIAGSAACQVLVARRGAGGRAMRGRIAIATDGSPESWAATEVAIHLAKTRHAELTLLQGADRALQRRREEIRRQRAVIAEASCSATWTTDDPGQADTHLDSGAGPAERSLIVVGRSRRREAIPGNAISDRVLREARCSVMVVPSPT
jgi:nucleotide-binding universal stress UspA family protein